jgi:surface protein
MPIDNNIEDVIKSLIKEHGNDIDLNHIDVQNVTDMSFMFYDSKFNGDISNWDVSNVKTMHNMFAYSKFNGDISKWNVQNVTDMHNMFAYSKFNGDISKWNVNNTNITNIFNYNNWYVDIIKEHYNGIIPKGKILDVLKLDYPEYFI